jgi:mannose-1-phosphate guanylyltransferase
VLQRIAPDRRVSIERETFPAIVADGGLWAVQSDAYWVDAGTPLTYLQVQMDLLDGVRGEKVDGIAPGASIAAGATVEHSVVMDGASVADGAVVRNAVVSHGAAVRADAVVDGSIVGPRAVVGERASVSGLSMIGADGIVDAGAQLVGARVPESD